MQSPKKKIESTQKNKLSLKEFVWFGFNFVFGGTFVSTYASFANHQQSSGVGLGNDGLGLWTLLVWVVVGGIAFICAKSFAKMSFCHNSAQNGAAYVYARSTFGRCMGLFVGFIQYCYLPFSLSFQIMGGVRGNLASGYVQNSPVAQNWGPFTDLSMDLISISVFVLCTMAIFWGMRWFKRLAHVTAGIKWFCVGLLILASFLILTVKDSSSNELIGSQNFYDWSHHSRFDIGLFIKCFNSSFFAFVGFELAVTAGKNIQNPNKNIGRGTIIIVAISVFIYVVLSLLMFTTVSASDGFADNYNVAIWNHVSGPKKAIFAVTVITIISLILIRLYVYLQKALYGGTTLQPLAYEGYFPDRFAKLNKDNLPTAATKLNLILVCCMSFIWLIIPDIIKGILMSTTDGVFEQKDVFFNMSAFSSFASLIAIFIYISVLLSTIYVMMTKQLINKNKWTHYSELIMYMFAVFILVGVFIYHYYALVENVINNHNIANLKDSQASIKAITGFAIELISTIGMVAFFFSWYHIYYSRKIKTRTISQQKKLDAPFKILTPSQVRINERNS